ncbi:ParB/RepB/Spo0J family partition protein [Brevundimonas sp. BAL450]|uniref:Chromosome-partitioning protein ParB n=1 Tax=Brevundimonas abyssalis TAR-001 TaxID=1391729 RepID=A0A8E0KID0_9CAUL|nr:MULTISPECIES: ParB/RepB/Spo0J family partition protein [Brevundimonas]MBG7616338.1 ParB/RepB/Spo0J family partition protein [Brevundimonas sp. BAL450]GAD58301.1 chromosome (plasmid) partitioning protein ParB / stage 0 sporulation protein J [Brevundimonas abyssalis TAR-001]
MAERQRGLGRGLSALIGDTAEAVAADIEARVGVRDIPIEQLHPNPDQPRTHFSDDEIAELSASIRDKGVLQPLLVRPAPGGDGWQIIAGERRWRASQKAGLKTIPVLVRELDDAQVLEIAIVENVQREDLNPVEEARAYRTLMERFNRTQDVVAGVVGKSRSHVANTLRLLALPDPVLDHVLAGRLSAGHARALITAPNPDELADTIIKSGLSVRQTEALARQAADGPKPAKAKPAIDRSADTVALEQDLGDALGLKVEVRDKGGKGELVIRYGALEQLDDLCRRLTRS